EAVGGDHEVDLAFGDPRAGEPHAQGSRAVRTPISPESPARLRTLDRGDPGVEGDRAAALGPGEALEERAATDAAVVAVAVEDAGDRVGAQDPAAVTEHPVAVEALGAGSVLGAHAEVVQDGVDHGHEREHVALVA